MVLPDASDLQSLLGFKLSRMKRNTPPSKCFCLNKETLLSTRQMTGRISVEEKKRVIGSFLHSILWPPHPVLKLNKHSLLSEVFSTLTSNFTQFWCENLHLMCHSIIVQTQGAWGHPCYEHRTYIHNLYVHITPK